VILLAGVWKHFDDIGTMKIILKSIHLMLSLGDDGHAPAFDKQVNIKTNKKQ